MIFDDNLPAGIKIQGKLAYQRSVIFKAFAITERYKVEFRSEFFNILNHVNFGNPSANVAPASIATFGKLLTTIGDPRDIQFALKLYF